MKLPKSAPSIFVNFGMSGIAQALGRVFRFLLASIAIHNYGAAAWGEVAFGLTVVSFAGFFLDMGISTLATVERPSDEKLDRIFFLSLGWVRFFPAALGVGLAWIGVRAFSFEGGLVLGLYLLFLVSRPLSLDWYLQRKGYNGLIPMIQVARQALVLGAVLTGYLHSIALLAIVDVATEMIAALATWFVGPKKGFAIGPPQAKEWGDIGSLYRMSAPLFIGSSLILLHQNLDVVVIRFFLGLKDVGVYDYSMRVALFAFLTGAGLSIPLRRQLAHFGDHEREAVQGLIRASHKVLGGISTLFMLFAIYLAPYFFPMAMPPENVSLATDISRILAIFLVLSFLSVPLSEWLITRKDRKLYLVLASIAAGANIVLNLIMIPQWGLPGAALAKVGSEFCILSYLLWKNSSEVRQDTLKLALVHLAQIPAMIWVMSGNPITWEFATAHLTIALGLMYGLGYFDRRDLQLLRKY
jgi:O-antigen/teichoic acid export membrane protein